MGGAGVASAFPTSSGDLFVGGNFTLFRFIPRNRAALLVGNPQIGAAGFASPLVAAFESGLAATLSLRRYVLATEAASILYSTANGTALAGTDNTPASGTVTWPAGDATDKTVVIPLLDNAVIGPNKTFFVNLSAPVGPITAAARATVRIVDDQTPVTYTTQPVGAALTIGGDLALSAVLCSPLMTTYQWFRNGVALPGATAASLHRIGVTTADAGAYTLVAANASGTFTTTPVFVSVLPRPGRLAADQSTSGRPIFMNGAPTVIVSLTDGGALIGGSFSADAANNVNQANLIRVRADGRTDPSFTLFGTGTPLLRQPDGKILVGGPRLLRLNADLTRDTAFTTNASPSFLVDVSDLALDSTGRIYVGLASGGIRRFAANGTPDAGCVVTTPNHGSRTITALAMQADDTLLMAGDYSNVNNASPAKKSLARLHPDGTTDLGFTNGLGSAAANDLLVTAGGRRLASGSYSGPAGVVEFAATGGRLATIDSPFTGYRAVQAPGGKVLVLRASTVGSEKLIRLTETLGADSTFDLGTGFNPEIRSRSR